MKGLTRVFSGALVMAMSFAAAPGFGQDDGARARFPSVFRSVDGRGNNIANPSWGSAGAELLRRARPDYADSLRAPSGSSRLSARAISNLCADQTRSIPSANAVSSFVWQWGQFLDHDLSLSVESEPAEAMDIEVPRGDPFFDPTGAGGQTIPFRRSQSRMAAGARQQINSLTAFIDGSQVYGSDPARARALRANDGSGRLSLSSGELLPFNEAGLDNAPSREPSFFVAGDVRANEQVGLLAMHVVFAREHNFWAEFFRSAYPELGGEELYERSRAMVTAEMQAITYNEFLPVLLGSNALPAYRGYEPNVNAGITNEFAAAAFRFGHSMLPNSLLRLDASGQPIPAGNLSLADAFFAPREVTDHGIDPILRGLLAQPAQEVDPHVVDEVRNFLFGGPGSGGFDLASLNVQRGRDHGLPSYNQLRRELGLVPARSFADISPDTNVQENLMLAFANVEDIDPWMGGLSEPHVAGGLVGETFRAILLDQFRRSRDGDRFWYEAYLPVELVTVVRRQTLSVILARNTGLDSEELPADVFRVPRR